MKFSTDFLYIFKSLLFDSVETLTVPLFIQAVIFLKRIFKRMLACGRKIKSSSILGVVLGYLAVLKA